MKVMHVSKTPRGAAFALRQCQELLKLGVDVEMVLPDGGPMVQKFRDANIKIHLADLSLPTRAPWQIPKKTRMIRDLVAEVQPDIIHSHFVSTTLMLRLALRKHSKIPRLFQVPGPLHLESPLIRRTEIGVADGYDYWMGSCLFTNTVYAAAGIDEERIGLSYYGTYVGNFDNPSHRTRAELGLSDDTYLVGMVGYFYAPKPYLGQSRGIKGHEDLIDAIALLRDNGRDITCVFIGNAWTGAENYGRKVQQYAKEKIGEHGVFLGYVENVATIYPILDVAVHPSHSENCGPAVESLMLGIPTIASNVGGVPDIVVHNETGYLIEPKNPESIAAAIERAMDNPDEMAALTQAGKSKSREMFDVRNTARTTKEMYDRIIAREQRVR